MSWSMAAHTVLARAGGDTPASHLKHLSALYYTPSVVVGLWLQKYSPAHTARTLRFCVLPAWHSKLLLTRSWLCQEVY